MASTDVVHLHRRSMRLAIASVLVAVISVIVPVLLAVPVLVMAAEADELAERARVRKPRRLTHTARLLGLLGVAFWIGVVIVWIGRGGMRS